MSDVHAAAVNGSELARLLTDARKRTLDLVADLDDRQMIGPRLAIVNPPLWEIGHIAWFQEFWTLRHVRGERPCVEGADSFYDSAKVAHDTRWDLPIASRERTLAYMNAVLDCVCDDLAHGAPTPEETYFHLLVLFHEDMHDEALAYTRQTLGYPKPAFCAETLATTDRKGAVGDVEVPGGTFMLGAPPDSLFVFDNEKWAHPVEVKPFHIARAAVTNAEFAAFVDDGGYRRKEFWTTEGWNWLHGRGSPPSHNRSRNSSAASKPRQAGTGSKRLQIRFTGEKKAEHGCSASSTNGCRFSRVSRSCMSTGTKRTRTRSEIGRASCRE